PSRPRRNPNRRSRKGPGSARPRWTGRRKFASCSLFPGVPSGAGASGAIAEPTGGYRPVRQGFARNGARCRGFAGGAVTGRPDSGGRGIVAAWPVVAGCGVVRVLEHQFEFGGGGQAFEAFLVGERGRALGHRGRPDGRGRRRRGGVGEATVVGDDQRQRRDCVVVATVEQGEQIHGLITSLGLLSATRRVSLPDRCRDSPPGGNSAVSYRFVTQPSSGCGARHAVYDGPGSIIEASSRGLPRVRSVRNRRYQWPKTSKRQSTSSPRPRRSGRSSATRPGCRTSARPPGR